MSTVEIYCDPLARHSPDGCVKPGRYRYTTPETLPKRLGLNETPPLNSAPPLGAGTAEGEGSARRPSKLAPQRPPTSKKSPVLGCGHNGSPGAARNDRRRPLL